MDPETQWQQAQIAGEQMKSGQRKPPLWRHCLHDVKRSQERLHYLQGSGFLNTSQSCREIIIKKLDLKLLYVNHFPALIVSPLVQIYDMSIGALGSRGLEGTVPRLTMYGPFKGFGGYLAAILK